MRTSVRPGGAFTSPAAAFFAGLQGSLGQGMQGGIQETLSTRHEQEALQRMMMAERARQEMENGKQADIMSRYFVNNYGVPPEDLGPAANYVSQSFQHPAQTLSTVNQGEQVNQDYGGTAPAPSADLQGPTMPGHPLANDANTMALLAGRNALVGAKRIQRGPAGGGSKTDPYWKTVQQVKQAYMSEMGLVDSTFKDRLKTDPGMRKDFAQRYMHALSGQGLDTKDMSKISNNIQGVIGEGGPAAQGQ